MLSLQQVSPPLNGSDQDGQHRAPLHFSARLRLLPIAQFSQGSFDLSQTAFLVHAVIPPPAGQCPV